MNFHRMGALREIVTMSTIEDPELLELAYF